MLSASIHSQLAQARVGQLHRSAPSPHRRPVGIGALIRRAIARALAGGPARSDALASIHGIQLAGGEPTATEGRRS